MHHARGVDRLAWRVPSSMKYRSAVDCASVRLTRWRSRIIRAGGGLEEHWRELVRACYVGQVAAVQLVKVPAGVLARGLGVAVEGGVRPATAADVGPRQPFRCGVYEPDGAGEVPEWCRARLSR